MAGVNLVVVMGNLGHDPSLKEFDGGGCVANFSVATSERWKDKNSGEQKERTEWHRCVAHGKTAEFVKQYFTKGKQIHVVGKLQTREWEKGDQTHYSTEIHVREVSFCGSKADEGGGKEENPYG